MAPILVLASASLTRQKILGNAGFTIQVQPSNFDESQIQAGDPAELVQQLAMAKATQVASFYQNRSALVVGCDSVMELNGQTYGKPESIESAIAQWQMMRGGKAKIYTGHCLIDTKQQIIRSQVGVTQVYFVNGIESEIVSYIQSGEPLNCAGCFTLEGLGGLLIEKIEGCHTNVLGLSLPILRQLLRQLGYGIRFTGDRAVELVIELAAS
ncbi:MAG: nucleoside triphosphate pyrophosphatase [Pseudanabaenaceae cyanobacterium bins.68]|nr:nucleoside triphosphate pyrophosphatase [Pseudanabaenaceae cyanobacterium bins.68]